MKKLDYIIQGCLFCIVLLFMAGCAVRYSEPVQSAGTAYGEPPPQYYSDQPAASEDLPVISPEVSITVAPPVVIGEPVYYPPPITVVYPYNYFYYSTDASGYVNLVFVDANNGRHVENWYVSGARMRHDRLDSWRRSYRISSRDYNNHRSHVNEHRHEQRSSAPQRQRSNSHMAPAASRHDQPQSKPQNDHQTDRQPARANQTPRHDPSQVKPQPERQPVKANQPSRRDPSQSKPQAERQPARANQAPRHEPAQTKPQQVPKQAAPKHEPPPKKHAPGQFDEKK